MERLENELCYDYNYELYSFPNPSVTLPMSQLILQLFSCFTYVTTHSPTFPSIHLCHSSFSNPSIPSPMLQLILQAFSHLTYVTPHSDSPSFPSLHLRNSSFSSPSFASPTSQVFTYVTWRAAHGKNHYGGRAYLVFIGSLRTSGLPIVSE